MTNERSLVAVIDDDESVRESLPDLLTEFGKTECLILDIAMPGMTGHDLQRELIRRWQEIPTVFITAHADETVGPRALEQGAVECVFKPFSDTALLKAINAALRRD